MSQAKAPRRTPRVPTGRTLHMNPEQARRLTALKSRRAARVSREAAAGRRRLVTTGVSLSLMLLFVGLAAFTPMSWWWTAAPGAFLLGTLVASRQAGIRNERARVEETRRIRELEEEIYVGRRPKAAAPTEASNEAPAGAATAEAVEVAPKSSVPEAAVAEPVDETSESARPAAAAEVTEEADRGWSVASFPAPSYARKQKVTGRQVHPDTDIVAIAQVSKVPGRPVSATRVDEAAAVAVSAAVADAPMTGGFDLESVLEARLAAR